jgi:hypothetical protein
MLKAALINNKVDIVEYLGGPYSSAPIISADAMILIGHPTSKHSTLDEFYVGKGVGSELFTFAQLGNGKENAYVCVTENEIYKITQAEIIPPEDADWKTKAYIIYLGDEIKLNTILGND